jgi:hypothetical protein
MTMRSLSALAVVGLVAAAPAVAQPRLRPSRDVVVTYAVDGPAAGLAPGGLPGPVRLSWDAAGQRLRAEADGRSQVALVDLRAHGGQAIDTTLRVALPLKLRADDLQVLTLDGVRLTPGARQTIAGLTCTEQRFDSAQGPGMVCLSADGVPLRGQGMIRGKPGTFTAQSVRYGALPPSLFEVPPGYIALSAPGGQSGGLAGLAARLGGAGAAGALGALLGGRVQ